MSAFLEESSQRGEVWQVVTSVSAGCVLGLCLLGLLRAIVPAILWAGVLAIALWPSYAKMHAWSPARLWQDAVAPLLFTTAVGLVIATPIVFAAIAIGDEAKVGMAWVDNSKRFGARMPVGIGELPWVGVYIGDWWKNNLTDPSDARAFLRGVGPAQVVSLTRSVGPAILHRTLLFVVALIILFFLFRDGAPVVHRLQYLGRWAFGQKSDAISQQIVRAIHGTVNGLVLVGLGEGAVIGMGYFVTGLPHAIIFTVITSLLAIIPFGAAMAFCSAGLLLLGIGEVGSAVSLVVFGFMVLFATDHFIRPILIGGATDIPFFLVFLGLIGGVSSLGIVGLFVGPATMAALVAVWRQST